MKLKTGNPRVHGPRKRNRGKSSAQRVEPSTFAWFEPLADVDPVMVDREVVVESHVDRPVYIDRPVEVPVEKIVEREVIVEKPVFVDRRVEVPVEKIVEKIVERPISVETVVERVIEKPVTIEKIITVEKPVDRIITVERPVEKIVEKPILVEREVVLGSFSKSKDSSDKKKSKDSQGQKAIIVGRGPSFASKVGRIMPKPLPVLAGAASLLAVIAALSLMSPSGDNASAERARAKAQAGATAASPSLTLDENVKAGPKTKSRDPFAAKDYKPEPTTATAAVNAANARTKAAAPALKTQSLFTANLETGTSYSPFVKTRKRANGWVDFDDKPTIKVLAVGKKTLVLFAVTDVEFIKEKSSKTVYDKPVRQITVQDGGTVRFADYRNIQGDDVTYTIRFDGSDPIK